MNRRTIVLAALLGLGMACPMIIATAVSAEIVAQSATGPSRGMSMEQVKNRYGGRCALAISSLQSVIPPRAAATVA